MLTYNNVKLHLHVFMFTSYKEGWSLFCQNVLMKLCSLPSFHMHAWNTLKPMSCWWIKVSEQISLGHLQFLPDTYVKKKKNKQEKKTEGFESRNNLSLAVPLSISLCLLSFFISLFLTLPSATRGYKFEYANAAWSRCMTVGTESGRPRASYARQIACRNKAPRGHHT